MSEVHGPLSFPAAEAIGVDLLVTPPSSGAISVASATQEFIGVSQTNCFAAGEMVAVRPITAEGTIKCTAAGPIAEGAIVYGKAGGMVDDVDAGSDLRVGIALKAATGAGDKIPVLVSPPKA